MTVANFTTWLRTTFPHAEWRFTVDIEIESKPAYKRTWLGTTDHVPAKYGVEPSYTLRFNRNIFDKDASDKTQTFTAPSLEALQSAMVGTLQSDVEQVCKELETLT